jgi:multiple sugar transport system substrate-binding protein
MGKKQHIPKHLSVATQKYMRRGISRRDFLRYTGAAGLTFPMLNSLIGRVAAQDAESSSAVAERIAAERYAGETLNVTWESGLQAQDPKLFSGPLWTERTGVNINVIEIDGGTPYFSRQLTEHLGASGAFDVLNVQPSWVADYVFAGVMEPLDAFVEEFMNPADLEDYTPLYKDLGVFDGVRYGLFDDGDTLIMYYRKDLFEEHAAEFADAMGYELAPPTNWLEFDQIAKFLGEKLGPDVAGAGFGRGPGAFWNAAMFIPHFKANGGRFFDPDSMDALVNGPEGVRTVSEMNHSNQFMPEGITTLTAVDTFQQWLAGAYAMTWFWPPLGRWSAAYGTDTEELAFVPESTVVGKTGYALFPGHISQMSGGFNLAVSADSPRKELAYLFIQWLNSPEISLQRVTLPYALRDPYRLSHFESEEYAAAWPEAPEYLATLLEAGENASLDINIPGGQEYSDAIDRACSAVYAGTDPQEAMDTAASEFNGITDRLGREQQATAYAAYLQLPGAYPSTNLVDAPSNLDMDA